jgi:tRNA nucleotidyltransferase/poly(A) polymerase
LSIAERIAELITEVVVMPKIFEVGGKVRDELLGRTSSDADYTFVLTEVEAMGQGIQAAFGFMKAWMVDQGFHIFLETPDCLTIRAKFPDSKLTADFVLASRALQDRTQARLPLVIPGSLEDDLLRRDFTVNAMARSQSGELIDLFEGQADLRARVLRTPLEPMVTLADDPLRALRAVRFSVKLGFVMAPELQEALQDPLLPEMMAAVSSDRIREELAKSFKADTWGTLQALQQLPEPLVRDWLERPGFWLMPTTKR